LIVAGWLKALLVSAAGKRSGFIALLAFSLFATLIGLYDLQYLLNTPMPWPEQVMVLAMLAAGAISAAVLGLHIGMPRPSL
jgi:TRAP-type C4-dicarboxylate transport system permease small subunit